MTDTFVEAVRASTQPCTFLLLAPTLVTTFVVRATWSALAATLVAAITGGWMLAANVVVLHGAWLQLSAALVVAMWTLAAIPTFRGHPLWSQRRGARVLTAGCGTLVATLWWRPCVGEQLGRLLNGAQTDLVAETPGLAVYMVGAMTPALVVTLAARAVRLPVRVNAMITATAAAVGCAIGAAVMLGRHDSVVVALTRWTGT